MMFVAGIIVAILVSSALSTVIATQFAVGPQGPVGPQGSKGDQGYTGEHGVTGPQGLQGVTGSQGVTGPQGAAGATGADGAQGIQGPEGDTGPQGLQGIQGPVGGFGAPDYDSGWVALHNGETVFFTHNLGTEDNLFVYLYGRALYFGQWVYHQDVLGTDTFLSGSEYVWIGASWYTLNENEIGVVRATDDLSWDECRVLIWEIEEPTSNPLLSSNSE